MQLQALLLPLFIQASETSGAPSSHSRTQCDEFESSNSHTMQLVQLNFFLSVSIHTYLLRAPKSTHSNHLIDPYLHCLHT